jgi:hypothetical protein
MTDAELQQQREHEAAMNSERKAFGAEWSALSKQIAAIPGMEKVKYPALHHAAWLVWRAARNTRFVVCQ